MKNQKNKMYSTLPDTTMLDTEHYQDIEDYYCGWKNRTFLEDEEIMIPNRYSFLPVEEWSNEVQEGR